MQAQQTATTAPESTSTIVQIIGDGNTVVAGHPHLRLTRYVGSRVVRESLDLLSPYTRTSPIIGRDQELAELQAYIADPRRILFRVLKGPGGRGKTRIALELAELASASGWISGFVRAQELKRFRTQHDVTAWRWQSPTLIVIDYAAQHAVDLAAWTNELSDVVDATHPLRILLLERDANMDAGWCEQVFASGSFRDSAKRAMLDPPQPVELAPLRGTEEKLALLEGFLQRLPGSTPLSIEGREALRRRLPAIEWTAEPLYLLMAAMSATQYGTLPGLELGRIDLAISLAHREASRIRALATSQGLDGILAAHLAACVTLFQGMTRRELEQFTAAEKTAVGRPSGDAAVLVDLLEQALGTHGRIAPIVPDLIGEAFVLEYLHTPTSDAVLRCLHYSGLAVAQTVTRCVQDFASQRPETTDWLAAICKSCENNEAALEALYSTLSNGSAPLAELNVFVAQRLVSLRPADAGKPDPRRAAALSYLAVAYAQMRLYDTALGPAQESSDIYCELAAEQTISFKPPLARSLTILATLFGDLDRNDEALQKASEAVDIMRRLDREEPGVFQIGLALSLNGFAQRLAAAGMREESWRAAQEAVNLLRRKAAGSKGEIEPLLAVALNVLGTAASDIGDRETALRAIQEAVAIRRRLAAGNPSVFRQDLAVSLNTLSGILSEAGATKAALEAAQQAVAIRRDLATVYPEVFGSDLAVSLSNLAVRIVEFDPNDNRGLVAATEAIQMLREFMNIRPFEAKPVLAKCLSDLVTMYRNLGQHVQALEVARESVALVSELAAVRPAAYGPGLALALNNLGAALIDTDQIEEAIANIKESIRIRRDVSQRYPDRFLPELGKSLSNLSGALHKVGDYRGAVDAATEAVGLFRSLVAKGLEAYKTLLAISLHNQATMLAKLQQFTAALDAEAEAVSIGRNLAEMHPLAFRAHLAAFLDGQSRILGQVGNYALAREKIEEAIGIRRDLVALQPDAHGTDLSRSLALLAAQSALVGLGEDAIRLSHEALLNLMPTFSRNPSTIWPTAKQILDAYLESCFRFNGQTDSALLGQIAQLFSTIGVPR
jgi:tetratricopeptide (TPR) repeat protein